MDIYTFRETPTNCITPYKRRRASCLMRHEIAASTSACNEFKREMSLMKLKLPFLTESQIKGRTMDKFGIPNIMGKPYKLKSGSVTYSTVNHILYLIKRSVTEKKSCRKNSYVRRRHTISGAYIPIEIITRKCDEQNNMRSRQNLERKFSLYSEDNDMSDDDYTIESSSEYSRGRHSDMLSISEFGFSYQSDGDEVMGPYKLRKTYERKSLDNFPSSNDSKEKKKKVLEVDDASCQELVSNQNAKTSNIEVSNINLEGIDDKQNSEEMAKQRVSDKFKDSENQNEEADYISDTNSNDLSYSSDNKMEGRSINTHDTSERGSHDCNHKVATKRPLKSSINLSLNSQSRSRTNSEVDEHHLKETFFSLERKLNEEIDELQIIYENILEKKYVEVRKEDGCSKIKDLSEKKIASETSLVLESSQNMTNIYHKKPMYIKQSISVCSSEYVWQGGSPSSIESSSINSETQTLHNYFRRSQNPTLQKISIPFTNMVQSYKETPPQGNTLEAYKRRRGYCRKTSECIIVVDLEAQTDSEHNASVDELSTNSGEKVEVENKTVMIHPHDPASENSNDSISDTIDSASTVSDDSSKQDGKTDLNVAFSPHFATQNMSDDFSDEYLSSQETEIIVKNSQRSESSTNETENEGYFLANLFDDDHDPSTRQRTLRSTSVAENYSEDDEPTFVD